VPTVTSKDGTAIAYERGGDGPAVVLVGGGLDDGSENAPLLPQLSRLGFTVCNYARRGRDGSGDTRPYAVAREIEDLDALIGEVGAPAALFGASSGGALALEAVAAGLPVSRLALWEVPYMVGEEMLRGWREYVGELLELLSDGRRGDALELFMRMAGSSEEGIAAARRSAVWPALEELAPTLAYDAACIGDGMPPAERVAAIPQPTLVLTGEGGGFFGAAADALAASLPDAERLVLEGQAHVAEPAVIAPVLRRFFRK
jgi:pimeloyl-ACP methyl ester carboxylesterase